MIVWYLYIALMGCCSAPQWHQITIPQYNESECKEAQQQFINEWRIAAKQDNNIWVTCIKGYK